MKTHPTIIAARERACPTHSRILRGVDYQPALPSTGVKQSTKKSELRTAWTI